MHGREPYCGDKHKKTLASWGTSSIQCDRVDLNMIINNNNNNNNNINKYKQLETKITVAVISHKSNANTNYKNSSTNVSTFKLY